MEIFSSVTFALIIQALILTESDGDNMAVGDGGKSWGCLQIREVMILDVNRIIGKPLYRHEHAFDRDMSIAMFKISAMHYAKHRARHYGRPVLIEDIIRSWRGPKKWKYTDEQGDRHFKRFLEKYELVMLNEKGLLD